MNAIDAVIPASAPPDTRVALDLLTIAARIRATNWPEIDYVVGIATGGTTLAALLAFHLNKPLHLLHLHFRDEANTPEHAAPVLVSPADMPGAGLPMISRVLLVDDVAVTGKTLAAARALLPGHTVFTCVVKGPAHLADFVLFPEIAACVKWPWKTG